MAEDQTTDFLWQGIPSVLKYRDSDHSYRCKLGDSPWDRYVSNSTISRVSYMDPKGLMNHARTEALAGRHHEDTLKFAQDCGNAAHDQLEALGRTGKSLDLSGQPERVRGALQGMAAWWLDHSPKFIATEAIVCHPGLRFAGRLDFIAEIGAELVLCDFKTSEKDWSHFYKFKAEAAFAQLAGYGISYGAMRPDDPQPTARYILHVSTLGTYDFVRDLAPHISEESFRSKLNTYRLGSLWSKADRDARKAEAQLGLAA